MQVWDLEEIMHAGVSEQCMISLRVAQAHVHILLKKVNHLKTRSKIQQNKTSNVF